MSLDLKLDDADVLLLVRELAADALDRVPLASPRQRVRLAHDLARHIRLELGILETREAVAACEGYRAIEALLSEEGQS